MTRIDDTFARLKAEDKAAFVAYVMAGDPDFETSLEVVIGLPAAGVDVIELGMSFTDPMADGPAIQLAGQRALASGTDPQQNTGYGAAVSQGQPNHADRVDGVLQPGLQPRR